jgi:hypothetical protein
MTGQRIAHHILLTLFPATFSATHAEPCGILARFFYLFRSSIVTAITTTITTPQPPQSAKITAHIS